MATHMVPQDVEADDKLVGFLSLKQFIMTVIGLGFGYLTFFFFQKIHPIAALIWLPPTLISLVLGLYQRKDQPIEVFLASALTFYLKPRKRIWDQEGHEDHVVITAPPKIEHRLTKNFTGEEATSKLMQLSLLMDSRGWASKSGSDWQNPQLATTADSENRLVQPAEAPGQLSPQQLYTQPADVMDTTTSIVARDFDNKISQEDTARRTHAIQVVEQARAASLQGPQSLSDAGVVLPTKQSQAIHQKIIQPITNDQNQQNIATTQTTTNQNNTTGLNIIDTSSVSTPSQVIASDQAPSISKSQQSQAHVTEDGSVEISLH